MKVYLLTENIDLGYQVLGVYNTLNSIPYSLSPTYAYKYLGTNKEEKILTEDSWDVQGEKNWHVYSYEVKG